LSAIHSSRRTAELQPRKTLCCLTVRAIHGKFVNRLCSTAAASVHFDANRTPFLAAVRLSFNCWIRHFNSLAPIDLSTIWRTDVQNCDG